MSSTAISLIPSKRRDEVFAEIRRKVNEIDAVDRALEAVTDEGIAIDECLEEIAALLGSECRRAKKLSRAVAA